MAVTTARFTIETNGYCDIRDITEQVAAAVKKSGLKSGNATVFIAGSTAGLTTIEYENGAVSDLRDLIEELAPRNRNYAHNATWQDGNGFSHVRSALLHTSFTVPFTDQRLLLGIWQQIVLLDFDNRHRRREVIVQIVGE